MTGPIMMMDILRKQVKGNKVTSFIIHWIKHFLVNEMTSGPVESMYSCYYAIHWS